MGRSLKRRRLQEVADLESMEKVATQFNRRLWQLVCDLEPTGDPGEEKCREQILADTARLGLRAALTILREFHPEHHESVMRAVTEYGRGRLRGEAVEFRVRPKRRGELPNEWMVLPQILAIYERIVRELAPVWAATRKRKVKRVSASEADPDADDELKPGYGDAQAAGNARRWEAERRRVRAIVAVSETLSGEPMALSYRVGEKKARRWVHEAGTASAVALEMLADCMNTIRRNSEEILGILDWERADRRQPSPNFTAKSVKRLLTRARRQQKYLEALPKLGI